MAVLRFLLLGLLGWASALTPAAFGWPSSDEKPTRKVQTDLYGDPLPPGALARLGTVRFRHDGPEVDVAVSPQGKILASTDGFHPCVFLWDTATGKELRRLKPSRFTWQIQAPAFSRDGKLLACGGKLISLWEIATGKELTHLQGAEEQGWYRALAFSPDGKTLASGTEGQNAAVQLWDVATGRRLNRIGLGGPRVEGVAFSSNGNLLAFVAGDGILHVWDAVRRTAAWKRTDADGERGHTQVAFAPDARSLAVGDRRGNIILCEATTGRDLCRFNVGSRPIASLSFSPDGKILLTGAATSGARVWDPATGKELADLARWPSSACRGAFCPDGNTLILWGGDRTIRVWDLKESREKGQREGHGDLVRAVAVSPDGKTVATAGGDEVRFWDAATGKTVRRSACPDADSVGHVTFSPDGRTLASVEYDGTVRLWESSSGRQLRLFKSGYGVAFSAAFSPDSKALVSATWDLVEVWAPTTGNTRRCLGELPDVERLLDRRPLPHDRVAVTPGGIVVGATGNQVRLWDLNSGRECTPAGGFQGARAPLALSPDGRVLASMRYGMKDRLGITLWEVATGKERRHLDMDADPWPTLRFTPDGKVLLVRAGDGQLTWWSLPTGKRLPVPQPRTGAVHCFAFFPDGKRLVTADGTAALIWDMPDLGDGKVPPVGIERPRRLELADSALAHEPAASARAPVRAHFWDGLAVALSGGP
jgi:WD40 repeat protein